MTRVPRLLRYGGQVVRMTEESVSSSWVGPTAEPGVLLVLRFDGRHFLASLEQRTEGVRVDGKRALHHGAACASLLRAAKRLARASGLRVL